MKTDDLKNIVSDMAEGREYTSGAKESSWFSTDIRKLPLADDMIEALLELDTMVYIEKYSQGGETFETSCCVEQGIGGHNAMIPIETHRAMFIGTPEGESHMTCTFRYVSKRGIKSLAESGFEFEWMYQLPCFPKALIIQEINGLGGDAEWREYEGFKKGLKQNEPTPIPFPDDDGDPTIACDPYLFPDDLYGDMFDMSVDPSGEPN